MGVPVLLVLFTNSTRWFTLPTPLRVDLTCILFYFHFFVMTCFIKKINQKVIDWIKISKTFFFQESKVDETKFVFRAPKAGSYVCKLYAKSLEPEHVDKHLTEIVEYVVQVREPAPDAAPLPQCIHTVWGPGIRSRKVRKQIFICKINGLESVVLKHCKVYNLFKKKPLHGSILNDLSRRTFCFAELNYFIQISLFRILQRTGFLLYFKISPVLLARLTK